MEHLSFDEKDPNAEFPKAFTSAQAKYESSKYKEAIVDLNKAIEIAQKFAKSKKMAVEIITVLENKPSDEKLKNILKR